MDNNMKHTVLGRTGLNVSKVGLGGGGHSRLGLERYGEDHAASIVRRAYNEGVRFFDTAQVYGTEAAVGKGLKGLERDSYVLSSKFPPANFGEGGIRAASELTESLDETLKKLGSDHVDMLHLHAVLPEHFEQVRDTFLPVMLKAKEAGKIRFLGITEMFQRDTSHKMLARSLAEDHFDVIMTGYNLLNHSAEREVFPLAAEHNVGVLCMFAVRNALSNPAYLREVVAKADSLSQIPSSVDLENPFGFLADFQGVNGVIDAAYRFCAASEAIDVTLTGTSSEEHLLDNIASILGDPLPEALDAAIRERFGTVDCISGE